MDNITLNLNNLTEAERETLMALVKKSNKPESKFWKPKYGEQYWSINSAGGMEHYTWCDDSYDEGAWNMGNVFSTREIAEEEIKRNEIMVKWRRLSIEAGELENPWDGNHNHWCAYYDYVIKKIETIATSARIRHANEICFPTSQSLVAAVKEIGEADFTKYVLGVGLVDPYSYQGARKAQEAAE